MKTKATVLVVFAALVFAASATAGRILQYHTPAATAAQLQQWMTRVGYSGSCIPNPYVISCSFASSKSGYLFTAKAWKLAAQSVRVCLYDNGGNLTACRTVHTRGPI